MVTLFSPVSRYKTLPTEAWPTTKFPEPSRLTIVDAVFKFVAAFVRIVAALTLAADDPPTKATVAATEPVPLAVTSPVKAEIPVPAGVDQERTPEPLVVRTWFDAPAVVGKVRE